MLSKEEERKRSSMGIMVLFVLLVLQGTFMSSIANTPDNRADPADSFELSLEIYDLDVRGVDFSSFGEALMVGSQGLISRYDPSTNDYLDIQSKGSVGEDYEDVDHSPDDEALIVGQSGAMISVDPSYLKHPKSTVTGQYLRAVSWRSDGSYATIIGDGGTLLRYDPLSAGPILLNELNVTGYNTTSISSDDLVAIDWRPDGSYALILSSLGKVFKFSGAEVVDISGNLGPVQWQDVSWSPNGSRALLTGSSSSIYLFDASSENFTELTPPAPASLYDVAWSDNDTAYIIADVDGYISNIIRYSGSTTLEDIQLGPYQKTMHAIAFDHPGELGVVAGAAVWRYPNMAPLAPAVSLSSISEASITLTYTESMALDFYSYDIHLDQSSGFTPGPSNLVGHVTSGSTTSFTIEPLQIATKYYIVVRTCDLEGACAASTELEASTLDPTNPPPVTLSEVNIDYTTLTVQWTEYASADFKEYELFMADEPDVPPSSGTLIETINYQYSSNKMVAELYANTTYYFVIRVWNTNDHYADSNELALTTLSRAPPEGVSAMTAEANDDGEYIFLNWTVSDSSEFSHYEVHGSTVQGFTPDSDTLFFTDYEQGYGSGYSKSLQVTNMEELVPYYFIVRVVDTYGMTADSIEVSASYDALPSPVNTVVSKEYGAHYITLTWETSLYEPPDFSHYVIMVNNNGDLEKVGKIGKWDRTEFQVKDLTQHTTYQYYVYVQDKQGHRSVGSPSPQITTEDDQLAGFFNTLFEPECLCSGGMFGFIILISSAVALGKKYGPKGAALAIPFIIISFIIGIVSALNLILDAGIETWFFKWLVMLGLIGTATACIGVVASRNTRGIFRKVRARHVNWTVPILAYFVLWIIVSIAREGGTNINAWFIGPLFYICIALAISIVIVGVALSKYRSYKWRRDEAKRAAEKAQQEFDERSDNIVQKAQRIKVRLQELKKVAPVSILNDARSEFGSAMNAINAGSTVADQTNFGLAETHLENTDKIMIDIEAYIVAKQQAMKQLDTLRLRVANLVKKEAPRVAQAENLLNEAERAMEGALSLKAVQGAIGIIGDTNIACDESATSLKSAEDQLSELKRSQASLKVRIQDLKGGYPQKERDSLNRLSELSLSVDQILISLDGKPDLDALSNGRDKLRLANEILAKTDERERQRQSLIMDLDNLLSQKEDTSTWTIAPLDHVDAMYSKAKKALEKDQLGKARNAIEEGFGTLDQVVQMNKPKLVVVRQDQEIIVNQWEDLMIGLKNDGTANAQDIKIEITSPSAQLQELTDDQRSTFKILPGDVIKVPVAIQFTAAGSVPVNVMVRYSDHEGESYEEELSIRVEVLTDLGSGIVDKDKKTDKQPLKDFGIKVIKRKGISHGLYKFKVAIQNNGQTAIRDVNFRIIYNKKIFKLHHHFPTDYQRSGDSVDYGTIEPDTTTSVEFYLEAHMCTETKFDGVITFKDMYGTIHTMPMKTYKETLICPTFIDIDSIAPAQVKALMNEEGWKKDEKTYAVPSTLNLGFTYDIMKEAIESFDANLKFVFEETNNVPMFKEAWFYGETEAVRKGMGIKHVVIGKVEKIEDAGFSLKIIGASQNQSQLFALSSRLGSVITEAIQKQAKLSAPIQQIFQTVEIKDSVLTGSDIRLGGGAGMASTGSTGKTTVKDSVMVRSDIQTGGGETRVEDTVLQRSKIGGGAEESAPTSGADHMRMFEYKVYRDTLKQVYEDDIVTLDERNILKGLRKQLKISMAEHGQLEEEVLAEKEAKKAKKAKKK